MMNLTNTQKYYLCALNDKGRVPRFITIEVYTCVIGCAIYELLKEGYFREEENNKFILVKELGSDKEYLSPLYNMIKNCKTITAKTIAEKFMGSPYAHFNELGSSIIKSLIPDEYVIMKEAKGSSLNKIVFLPNKQIVGEIIQKIKDNMITFDVLLEDEIILTELLKLSGLLPKFCSGYEVAKIDERLEEARDKEQFAEIKDMVENIKTLGVSLTLSHAPYLWK